MVSFFQEYGREPGHDDEDNGCAFDFRDWNPKGIAPAFRRQDPSFDLNRYSFTIELGGALRSAMK